MTRLITSAFSLLETVIIVALTAFVTLTLGMLLVYFYKTNTYTLQQTTAVEQARRGVEDTVGHIREASYGTDGSYPIASAATSSLVFYGNVDSDPTIEHIKYTLQKGNFYRIVGEPVGNPPTYVGETLSTTTVILSVVNGTSTPIFRYYDTSGNELPLPINVSKIASIKTTIIIDVDVNRAPYAFTLSGGAMLRNLDNQL